MLIIDVRESENIDKALKKYKKKFEKAGKKVWLDLKKFEKNIWFMNKSYFL